MRQSRRSSTQTQGAPGTRELAAIHDYWVTSIWFEVRGAHLSFLPSFPGAQREGRHLEEALKVNMQKQVGGCEYPNCHASGWQRALLTISRSSLKAHSNLTALCTFASHFSSPSEFQTSLFFPLQFLAFQCCLPFWAFLGASQILATTESALKRWFMVCPTCSPVCFIRLAKYRRWAFWLLNL